MKKHRAVSALLFAGAIIIMATPASAQFWYNLPSGVAVTVVNEGNGPYAVDIDLTVDSMLNGPYYGNSTIYTNDLPFGSDFWATTSILGHFVNFPGQTTAYGQPFVFPGYAPAVNWGDGADINNSMLPLIGDGSGAFRGSFSHTYAENYERNVIASAAHPNSGVTLNYTAAPTRGAHFINTVGDTSVWATTSGAGTNWWWFGGGSGTHPMGIQNTAVVYEGNAPAGGGEPIPTLGWLGMLLLAAIVAGAGIFLVSRR